MLLMVVLISGASVLSGQVIMVSILLCLIAIALKRRVVFDRSIIYIILWALSISLFTSLAFNSPFKPLSYAAFISYVLVPYFVIKIVGNSFWPRFENMLYRMVIIVLPIYVLSLLAPSLFNSLHSVFSHITNDVFYIKESQANYWYGIFFTWTGHLDSFRNSGFMWEPGAYAFALILLLVVNICRNGVKFSTKNLVYCVSIATTFSTAGYIALACVMMVFVLSARSNWMRVTTILAFVLFYQSVYELGFMGEKIDRFIETAQTEEVHISAFDDDMFEANRLFSIVIAAERSFVNPVGYANHYQAAIESIPRLRKVQIVNGIGDFLVKWGWVGLIFFVVSIYKFLRSRSGPITGRVALFFLTAAILVCCFSNPISENPLMWLILLTPYISIPERRYTYSIVPK